MSSRPLQPFVAKFNLVAPQVAAQREQIRDRKDLSPDPIPVLYVEVDGTGVPMLGGELAGRAGKQPDGSAKTREVKYLNHAAAHGQDAHATSDNRLR